MVSLRRWCLTVFAAFGFLLLSVTLPLSTDRTESQAVNLVTFGDAKVVSTESYVIVPISITNREPLLECSLGIEYSETDLRFRGVFEAEGPWIRYRDRLDRGTIEVPGTGRALPWARLTFREPFPPSDSVRVLEVLFEIRESSGGLEDLWDDISGGFESGTDFVLGKIDEIWGVVKGFGYWFDELTGGRAMFVLDNINSSLDLVAELVEMWDAFTSEDCTALQGDLYNFVFGEDEGEEGIIAVLERLGDLVQWAVDVDLGIELPDFGVVKDYVVGNIPCFLLSSP